MNHGAERMRIHQSSFRTNLLAASLLLACAPLAQADGVDAAQEATPVAAATPQQAQALPEPQMALQTQASFVLKGVQHLDGLAGFPAHLISKFESSNQLSVAGDMQDDCAVGAPAISDGQFLMALFLEHAGPAHPHRGTLDASGHTNRR